MRRIFTGEFWNTPITGLPSGGRKSTLLVLFGLFMVCVVVAGIAAWRIIY